MNIALSPGAPFPYRGRVRTGCLTCRKRKVKCDEGRPTCVNCSKKSRPCVYKPRKVIEEPGKDSSAEVISTPGTETDFDTYPSPLTDMSIQSPSTIPSLHGHNNAKEDRSDSASRRWHDALQTRDEMCFMSEAADSHTDSPSTFISRDINLTTTMDILNAHESPHESWMPFFLDTVASPWITPYDALNWQRAKKQIVELAQVHADIQPALTALSALYKAQMHGLPISTAVSLYASAREGFETSMRSESVDIDAMLVVIFLLVLFGFVQYQSMPVLREAGHVLLDKLDAWRLDGRHFSPLAQRIILWIRMLHMSAMRGGGDGLLSRELSDYLAKITTSFQSLKFKPSDQLEPHIHLLETLSAPLFEFYFQLQTISGELAQLTHYHRPRSTRSDQEEVSASLGDIRARLHTLWDDRPTTLLQKPVELRSYLAPKIADPITALAGVCAAAWHAEFVEMDRIVGDPVSRGAESKHAIACIREIVEGEWQAFDGGKLNPGYLRPLFLCAIECMDAGVNRWAVERMRQIRDQICRSGFFASFGEALLEAELQKGRRVTSKYFCISHFGVSPPYL